MLLQDPSVGKFLAFQYAIDLNYGEVTRLDEDQSAVAGPGALDGISKCFKPRRAYRQRKSLPP